MKESPIPDVTSGSWRVEAMDAAKCPARHRTAPKVSSADGGALPHFSPASNPSVCKPICPEYPRPQHCGRARVALWHPPIRSPCVHSRPLERSSPWSSQSTVSKSSQFPIKKPSQTLEASHCPLKKTQMHDCASQSFA